MARMALHDILCWVLGSPNCYFEAPSNDEMLHPCMIYNYTNDVDDFADNIHYRRSRRYTITVIDEDPDSKIPSKLTETLPYCVLDRIFAVDGLTHFVFTLVFSGPRIKEE